MNSPITPAMVRDALSRTRSKSLLNSPGWEQGFLANWEHTFSVWAESLNSFVEEYRKRFGEIPDPVALLAASPAKGAAFWELDTLRLSVEMKIAVWRILLGCEILSIELVSDIQTFQLKLVLGTPFNSQESYASVHSEDIRLIRHFGTIEVGKRTHFQGYYAFA